MINGMDAGKVAESEPATAAKTTARRELIRRLAAAAPAVVAAVAGKSRLAAAS
jgi:hypothetical protein